MTDIQTLDSQYVAHTYARAPVTFVRGEGCHLYDEAGKSYIDMGSGIAVSALGYGDEGWVAAVSAQAGQLAHASNLYHTAPQALLAQRLCERTGMKRVFFGNSGAEANECAIKAARRYSALKHGENVRPVILTLENSFHGRTLATLAATGQDVFHHDFGPFPEGFRHIPANDVAALKTALDVGDVCALLIETIQGEGGVCCLTEEYIQAARELTEARDILLMVDEVQTGNGRTGNGRGEDEFEANQRVRLQLDAVASEALSGTVYFEIGDQRWGRDGGGVGRGSGGALGADGVAVEVKRAYIDWIVPQTDLKIRMGIQNLSLPSVAGDGNILDNTDTAAIVASYQFNENVGATLMWARPYNDNFGGEQAGRTTNALDNVDLFMLSVPLTFDGVEVTPWIMYGMLGKNAFNSGYDRNAGRYEFADPGTTALGGGYMTGEGLGNYPFGYVGDASKNTGKGYASMFWFGLPIKVKALLDQKRSQQ